MRVLVIGGGKVGAYLARELLGEGHVVSLIEAQPARAQRIGEDTDALVFEGDGTDVDLLKSADVARSDWALAVTGRDEDNLVACQLAQTLGAKHVLARLNDPANRPTFDALGVPVVAVTDIMAQVISREVEVPDLSRVTLLGRGKASLLELELPVGFVSRRVTDLDLPEPSLLITVVRGGDAFIPKAHSRLRAGDRVLAVTAVNNEVALRQRLCEIDVAGEVGRA